MPKGAQDPRVSFATGIKINPDAARSQCATSTMEVTDRYFVYFGFEGTILVSVGREKNILPFGHH